MNVIECEIRIMIWPSSCYLLLVWHTMIPGDWRKSVSMAGKWWSYLLFFYILHWTWNPGDVQLEYTSATGHCKEVDIFTPFLVNFTQGRWSDQGSCPDLTPAELVCPLWQMLIPAAQIMPAFLLTCLVVYLYNQQHMYFRVVCSTSDLTSNLLAFDRTAFICIF